MLEKHKLPGEEDKISPLVSQTRNIGYYSGIIFGAGYCLTFVGMIAVIVEAMARYSSKYSSAFGYWGYTTHVPAWFMASLIFYIIGIICAIYFGLTVIKNARSARYKSINIDTIASSIYAFSFTLIFFGISYTILASHLKLLLFPPICGILGPILLLIGFRVYHGEASEAKLTGAILMLVSVALIYFGAFRRTEVAPLLSEPTLEVISLLIVMGGAIIFSFPILEERLKQSLAAILLSISAILFSCGLMYFNFNAASQINAISSLHTTLGGFVSGYWFPGLNLNSIWIMFFGFLLLGISGILGLVTACLPLAISAKQLSTKPEKTRPEKQETVHPKKVAKVKYCTKCGASVSIDAVYCPKCGEKQP